MRPMAVAAQLSRPRPPRGHRRRFLDDSHPVRMCHTPSLCAALTAWHMPPCSQVSRSNCPPAWLLWADSASGSNHLLSRVLRFMHQGRRRPLLSRKDCPQLQVSRHNGATQEAHHSFPCCTLMAKHALLLLTPCLDRRCETAPAHPGAGTMWSTSSSARSARSISARWRPRRAQLLWSLRAAP